MKIRFALLTLCLAVSTLLTAQVENDLRLYLRSGASTPVRNINPQSITDFSQSARWLGGKTTAILQFTAIPSLSQRRDLAAAGMELLEYIPRNSYVVSFSKQPELSVLQRNQAIALVSIGGKQKMSAPLGKGEFPCYARASSGNWKCWISFFKTFTKEEVRAGLTRLNIPVTFSDYEPYSILGVELNAELAEQLAAEPFVEYIQFAPHGDQSLNLISRTNAKGNVLNAASAVGGFDLKGQNVVVGVGDDSDPQYHIDFRGRLINHGSVVAANHGTHVNGTVGGAGNILQDYQGYAPRSTLISQYFSGIVINAPNYVADHNMVVANNSYGDVTGDCDYAGTYDLISRIMDLQAIQLPYLQHVFASGNDGAVLNCSPYPASFKTVLGAYQSSKNVLVVGSTEKNFSISSFSSRGPVKDGRTKPEIMSYGRFLISTYPNNAYGFSSGTSMAAPAVSGGLALLYERYRQLNGNADPKSGLMKALVCNGGVDLGNTGADFTYGYGSLNLLRSIDMLNNTRYFISSVNHTGTSTHNITVPANTAQLKVMLYWNDPAATPLSAHTLVNDLDLELTDPSAVIHFPWLLDTVAANVNNAATTGADHINNMEQVVITNPAAGGYTITIKGTSVTQSPPQEYFVVYDFVPVSTTLTYPVGGEGVAPTETMTIQWDAFGDPANTYLVEYSTNNGGSWTTINAAVAANLRQLDWTVPNTPTEQALIRITRNGTAMVSTSNPFTILGVPTASLAATQCPGYISLNWTAVTGATDYEVFMLTGNEMTAVGTTTATNYIFSGLSQSTTYWVSVRARINGVPGKRAQAISRLPSTGTCAGTISDNDLAIEALVAPTSGRIATSTALTATTTIQARIRNLDDAAVNNFDMRYRVNGGAWVTENLGTTVAAGVTYTHSFATTYDFSAAGNYEVEIEVINQGAADPVAANNARMDTVKQIANALITLPFTDDLETADSAKYYRNYFGMEGIERYDYTRTSTFGRASTYLIAGMANSGSRSLLLDLDGFDGAGNTNLVTGTFNLNGINAALTDVRLDVEYKQHGDSVPHANNTIWVRGDDTQSWIPAFTLSANGNDPGPFVRTPSIEVSDLLNANGQNFSTSFQVRFGQFGYVRIIDNDAFQGNSFDDIRLYAVTDDIQMIAIDTPIANSCALTATTPVRIQVRNSSSNTVNNIPVQFSVDGGAPVIENIPTIGPDATVTYTFTATANLLAAGAHTVRVIVQYPTDDFPENDTLEVDLINSAVVTSFPYLETFESNNGNWYSRGKNDSWEYGTPASSQINRAANGTKAWKTRLVGNYNTRELSYLYSPCFNTSSMTTPTLSFSTALDFEDCGSSLCDGAYIEYSADGLTWTRLGAFGSGTNWYNKSYPSNNLWSIENYTRWHVATIALPTGIANLRLRFVVTSDPFVTREGMAIDDIHIYDNLNGIYDGATMGAPVNQTISGGTSWIDFTSGGKLVASLQPNNQNMGSTDVQAYIFTGGVRNDGNQYYHDRNITIKPATPALGDSALVRFYFLDTETEALINATGCATCTKPSMAYQLGVSKYGNTDDTKENGTIADNNGGDWLFINSDNVQKVPFDKGYYAEFRVKDFSEFWLSNGGLDNLTTLPVSITGFSAQKQGNNDVLLQWRTDHEFQISYYIIEVARTLADFQTGRFLETGRVNSLGNAPSGHSYSFTDAEPGKTGTRYYRLRIVERDGSSTYSAVRPVRFNNDLRWEVFPNPSSGIFQLVFQVGDGEQVQGRVVDAAGRTVMQMARKGTGFVEKWVIELNEAKYPAGMYLVELSGGEETQVFRLIKQ